MAQKAQIKQSIVSFFSFLDIKGYITKIAFFVKKEQYGPTDGLAKHAAVML
jgi:hypothetical protein